jgi:hypothetical protein
MLRKQVNESDATYQDPIYGLNLHDSEEDLKSGEARLMQNVHYDGGTRLRRGSQRLTEAALSGTTRIRGGHKFYYGGSSPASKRLVAYDTNISVISNAAAETVLTSGMTADLDTFFLTWSITDKVYISNGTDVLRQYDGTTFATTAGTNIPIARAQLAPINDRLLAITTNGIERTNARDPTIWSSNSAWATFRPDRVGLFTALASFTIRGSDSIYDGVLAFQPNAWYLITGTDFGTDVTAGTASAGEDATIRTMDQIIGTSSPYAIASVPGIGLFWFTSDLNVAFLQEGSLVARLVGDRIRSTGSTPGIEATNTAAIGQVVMVYFDRKLWLGIPTGSATYPSRWFWLDTKSLQEHPDRGFVWSGPHTGFTVGRLWVENQQSDNALFGGEGNPSTGAFVYRQHVSGRYMDAIGLTDTDVPGVYQTYFKGFGTPSREKRVQGVHFDLNAYGGTATCDLLDLDGAVESGLVIQAV